MLRKSVFILILSALCFSSFGQSVVKKLESAKSIQSSYQRKGADLQMLLDSADYYLTSNRDQSFYYLEQAYLLTLRKKNSSQHYLVLEKIGDYYAYYQQHDLAAKNYENALSRLPAKLNANPLLFKCGGQYLKSKQAKRSLTLYQKHEEHRNIDKMLLYEAYGDAYFQLNKMDSAMLYFQKSEVIAKNRKDATKLADLKLKMADVYKVKGKDKELDLLNQANVISRSNTNVQGIINSQSKIAEYYERNALPEEEINTRNQLIEDINLNSTALDSMSIDVTNEKNKEIINIAQTLNTQNQLGEALDVLGEVDFEEVSRQDKSSLELHKEAMKTMSEVYFKLGKESEALKSYEQYAAILDRLYRESENEYNNIKELNNQLRSHQGRIDFLEKDKLIYDAEMEMVEQQGAYQRDRIRYQNMYIVLLVVALLLLIVSLVMIAIRYRIQRKHNNYLALKSLRAQMNPHFIFNALNSINNFIVKNDERNANKYLARFSRLMRSILNNSEEDFIPLEKEIEILELYLQLENVRFADKFSYTFAVSEAVNVDNFHIPPMLIQPYIENAVWHGLRYKEEGGYLKVEMTMQNEFLHVLVEDNGIGRQRSQDLKTENQKSTESKGIKTTTERLRILSEMYKKDILSEISDVFENGEGTRVELWIPNIGGENGN